MHIMKARIFSQILLNPKQKQKKNQQQLITLKPKNNWSQIKSPGRCWVIDRMEKYVSLNVIKLETYIKHGPGGFHIFSEAGFSWFDLVLLQFILLFKPMLLVPGVVWLFYK